MLRVCDYPISEAPELKRLAMRSLYDGLVLPCRNYMLYEPPILLAYRSSSWFILTTVCLALFTVSSIKFPRQELSLTAAKIGRLYLLRCTYAISKAAKSSSDEPKVVPVLPFSLSERSGIPEDKGIAVQHMGRSSSYANSG